MLLGLSWARHLRVLAMQPFHLFLRVLHTFAWFLSIFILPAALPFHKIPKLFPRFIPSSNLSSL